eukprot:gene5172-5410_t
MAIPRAYFAIGSLAGTGMLVGVGVLTYFTLAVLVQGSAATGASTYSQLTRTLCGGVIMKVLQVAVLAFCFGFGVVYLVIIRDILRGAPPACNGLICELFGIGNTGPLADPRLIIAAVALLFCTPLLLFRSMDKLSSLNIVGVAAIAMLAAVAAGLGIQALVAGSAHSIPLLPQWTLLGPTTPQQLQALTAVMPVMIACYVAHQSLHPLMPLLKPYSDSRMCAVIAAALSISFGVFTTLAVGSSLAFGPVLDVNVLTNFSVSGLEPATGPFLARMLSWSIRGGYLIALLASLLLYMHPLRGCLAEMIWQKDEEQSGLGIGLQTLEDNNLVQGDGRASNTAGNFSAIGAADTEHGTSPENQTVSGSATAREQQQQYWQCQEQRHYYLLTYGLLVVMVLCAITVPNIWAALSIIGKHHVVVEVWAWDLWRPDELLGRGFIDINALAFEPQEVILKGKALPGGKLMARGEWSVVDLIMSSPPPPTTWQGVHAARRNQLPGILLPLQGIDGGAVELLVVAADADVRATMYGVPAIGGGSGRAAAAALSAVNSPRRGNLGVELFPEPSKGWWVLLKVGPHWVKSDVRHAPELSWQVSVPIYHPTTTLILVVYGEMGRGKIQFLGKLQYRISYLLYLNHREVIKSLKLRTTSSNDSNQQQQSHVAEESNGSQSAASTGGPGSRNVTGVVLLGFTCSIPDRQRLLNAYERSPYPPTVSPWAACTAAIAGRMSRFS